MRTNLKAMLVLSYCFLLFGLGLLILHALSYFNIIDLSSLPPFIGIFLVVFGALLVRMIQKSKNS